MQKSIDIFLGYAVEDKELWLEVKKRLRWLEPGISTDAVGASPGVRPAAR